ncbi:hypothetical protein [Flavobacterium capsici]|uniref:Uncharacterized protein n=1 Tax=Flavobacterium capsici TaxID=3075618 RepID=A0AA96ETX2_9FLAO|nr:MULTISPECIES: hypothetical protein [unclassified Flavobacterium]WNM18189.1 hypothetical protein RN608_09200 [Flavobacterium sp. PMR2A8]WNM22240.1 hypothetical protein RN605_02500 [Flavobacterium sp. PMTSA4]
MKKYILLFFLFSSLIAKADTIATWNVFYNNKLLKQFNENPALNEIKIKLLEYKLGDYLAIQYGDDTPSHDCKYELVVATDTKLVVFSLTTKDKYELMKIDLKEIIADFKSWSSPQKFYLVYFTEINKQGKRDTGRRLFTIKLE